MDDDSFISLRCAEGKKVYSVKLVDGWPELRFTDGTAIQLGTDHDAVTAELHTRYVDVGRLVNESQGTGKEELRARIEAERALGLSAREDVVEAVRRGERAMADLGRAVARLIAQQDGTRGVRP